MAIKRIRVRNKLTGAEAWIAESALRHFPAYQRADTPPDQPPAPAAAESAEPGRPTPKPRTSRKEGDR